MKFRTTLVASGLIAASLISGTAHAATWEAVALGYSPDVATAEFRYSGAPFVDGQYSSSFVLANDPGLLDPPYSGWQLLTTISLSHGIAPPFVDTVAKTINLSSITVTYWESHELDCDYSNYCTYEWGTSLSDYFGPRDPVPYTQNADGTFTASWAIEDYGYWMGNGPFYFTFAAQVPEPAPMAMLAIGVALVFGITRRRFQRA
jgi:hypothetical protein